MRTVIVFAGHLLEPVIREQINELKAIGIEVSHSRPLSMPAQICDRKLKYAKNAHSPGNCCMCVHVFVLNKGYHNRNQC